MIRLTDKMGIFPAVNMINKKRNRNSPSSPRKYSSLPVPAKRLLYSLPKPEKWEMSTVEYVITYQLYWL